MSRGIVTSGFTMPTVGQPSFPDAPVIGTAFSSANAASVNFTPGNSRGSPILFYLIFVYVSGQLVSAPIQDFDGSPTPVTGLTNGVTYNFTVRAVNAFGTSPESAHSNDVTPSGVNPLSAISAFTLTRQGGTTNGQFPVTAPLMQMDFSFVAATGPVHHYRAKRGINGGPKTTYDDTIPAGATTWSDTAANFFYDASNIQENAGGNGSSNSLGFTTWYDYDIVAVDAVGNEGPAATQLIAYQYQNGVSTCSNQDISFGMLQPVDYNALDPLGTRAIKCVKGGAGCGLQSATFNPLCFNFGFEANMFNYFYIELMPGFTGEVFDFQYLTRDPNGDGFPQANLTNLNSRGYGPPLVGGQYSLLRIPLSPLGFGQTIVTAILQSGVLQVQSIDAGVGVIDSATWAGTSVARTTPGATKGVWVWQKPNQTGVGNYNVGMGAALTDGNQPPLPPDVLVAQQFYLQRSNCYKTNLKDFTSPSGTTFYVRNMYWGRS